MDSSTLTEALPFSASHFSGSEQEQDEPNPTGKRRRKSHNVQESGSSSRSLSFDPESIIHPRSTNWIPCAERRLLVAYFFIPSGGVPDRVARQLDHGSVAWADPIAEVLRPGAGVSMCARASEVGPGWASLSVLVNGPASPDWRIRGDRELVGTTDQVVDIVASTRVEIQQDGTMAVVTPRSADGSMGTMVPECRVSGMFVVERMEWGGCVELEEGAVGVDQGGEQADTGVGVLSYLNKLQGNSMLFDELYYKNFGDDYISSLKPSLILLVFEATRSE
ncbi:hypothetical protein NDU88_001159 [Pleurodeles waltl]|uniref:Uncharacterized protein n=1 Tax=Pleurodeles waltl TaxID=8319 RepID=A0AAV7LBZ2_PLEWA|nr:hypothetical protein NDU88_001159 [Pleurodeles waltl]